MKDKLISKDEIRQLSPLFRGPFGDLLIKIGMNLTGLNSVNKIYDNSKMYEGVQFCRHLLTDIGVNVIYENREILDQFSTGAFITVSNHVYGHLDGIIAIDTVGSIRSDYKMMVNFVLGMIDTMSMHFITVNPYQSGKLASVSSLEGVKQCITHLKNGHPLGFFPAGAVSKTKVKGCRLTVRDREWQPSVIKLIKKSKVPVIPMYFSGNNSWFFNVLDLINWRLRTLRLGSEMANKKGYTISVRFGQVITPNEIAEYKDLTDLGNFLRDKTYELANNGD